MKLYKWYIDDIAVAAGLSKQQLAELLGVKVATIKKWQLNRILPREYVPFVYKLIKGKNEDLEQDLHESMQRRLA